ncbi:MAG: transposase [Gammaproteobacteria bacterium]
MPRHARLRVAGIPFHVIQRGHNRAPCFFSGLDRTCYLDELGRQARSNGVAVHAYVLMTNHVHLLMTAGNADGIPLLMKVLGQRYARHVNRQRQRVGTLWDGRYRSCLVDTDGYLLTCHRYIELNPVRAGIVEHPGEYPWSSHRANALGAHDPLVSPHSIMDSLGRDQEERRTAYRELFRNGLEPQVLEQIRSSTNGDFALGSERFQKEMADRLRQRVTRLGRGGARRRFKGV